MAKYYGMIGFADSKEVAQSVWEPNITERAYYGDVIRDNHRWESVQKVNEDFTITNQFSIIADPYATKNFQQIRYLIYMGVKWKVTSIEVQYPRLILSIGGVYNEESD